MLSSQQPAVYLPGQSAGALSGFSAGVCLHGHTLYSEEPLVFLPRFLNRIPGLSRLPSKVDFARAFFTPPLAPECALRLESAQIAGLGIRPMVSLTDHDNLDACLALQPPLGPEAVPVSVEWTVPYQGSIFHLGVHNLPLRSARAWMSALALYTGAPSEARLPEILSSLSRIPDVLIVLNHPFWLEEGITEAAHRPALDRLLRECLPWLHAFELNGTREWGENAESIELAKICSRPVISGGDRHACEPAACLNLTNAGSFSEFVCEIRSGHSIVMFQPHYRHAMSLRLFETACDILRHYPEYPARRHWMDRFFYRDQDGAVQSVAALWRNREPLLLRPATGTLRLLSTNSVRAALRSVFANPAGFRPNPVAALS